jgi:hypothetical protein
VATHFRFAFLSANFGIFLVALFAGLLLSFIATIGWARRFTRSGRLRAAGLVFVLPWLGILLADQIEHFSVHGPSVFLHYLVLPVALLLAIVLLFIRGAPDRHKDPWKRTRPTRPTAASQMHRWGFRRSCTGETCPERSEGRMLLATRELARHPAGSTSFPHWWTCRKRDLTFCSCLNTCEICSLKRSRKIRLFQDAGFMGLDKRSPWRRPPTL